MSRPDEDIEYLKSDHVGKIVAQGLADLYRAKPQHPLHYLGNWFINYSNQQQSLHKLRTQTEAKKGLVQDIEQEKHKREEMINEVRMKEEESVRKRIEFEDSFEKVEYPDELVSEYFPKGIFDLLPQQAVTAVYVGNLEYKKRQIDLERNDDEVAHLVLEEAKAIQYIGYIDGVPNSKIAQRAKKWVLHEGKGVTYKVFEAEAAQTDKQPDDPANGDENEKEPQLRSLYIADVVTEPNMHFFEIPRLGSYLAVPLIIKSYLNIESFDSAIVKLKEYAELEADSLKKKEEAIADFEEKIQKARDAEEDDSDLLAQYEEYKNAWTPVEKPDIAHEVKKFVLACDSLGKDQELTPEIIAQVKALTLSFANKWTATERRYIEEDVHRWNESIANHSPEEALASFNEEEERQVALKGSSFAELPPHKQQYKLDEIRLQTVKDQLRRDEDQTIKQLLALKEFRVLKYPRVLQNAFYLAGFTKEEINEAGTNVLNWRLVRKQWINQELIDKIFSYTYAGAKGQEVPLYAKINRINKRVSEISKLPADKRHRGGERLQRGFGSSSALLAVGHKSAHPGHQHPQAGP